MLTVLVDNLCNKLLISLGRTCGLRMEFTLDEQWSEVGTNRKDFLSPFLSPPKYPIYSQHFPRLFTCFFSINSEDYRVIHRWLGIYSTTTIYIFTSFNLIKKKIPLRIRGAEYETTN